MGFGKLAVRAAIISIWIAVFFFVLSMTRFITPFKEDVPTLNIFSWPEILSAETIERFEKETGIKVRRHYYTSNEELLVKLKATEGKGYDLIIPSDYMVKKLIEEDLLKPVDHSQLSFKGHFNPRLINQPFDPENTYSIPYIWEVLGFGINTEQYETLPFDPTWNEVFRPTHPNTRISMINDPIEAIDCTAHHLFGAKKEIGPLEIAQIHSVLTEQKPLVEAYAGVRGDYLLITKNCSLAVIPSSYVLRTTKSYPHIDFMIPKSYTFLTIENFCIPKKCENTEIAYTFLNYIYKPDVFALEAETYHNFPATTNIRPYMKSSPTYLKTLDALDHYEGTFYYTRDLLPETESRSLWIKVKAAS
ncbi:MAG: extracellular solute-binding protein [Chlamydiia bacterium]|nr:extracellular solute-binding protein [Chlamydiia bacterium]